MKIKDILLIALAILCVSLFLDRTCTSKKLHEAKGEYEQQKEVTESVQKKADKEIENLQSEIRFKDSKIERLDSEIEEKAVANSKLNIKTQKLEEEYKGLTDKDEIIGNLLLQVRTWKERFSLASNIIKDQEQQIFLLKEKCELKDKIIKQWKVKFDEERALRLSTEKLVKETRKEIIRLKLASNLKTGGMAILAAAFAYSMVKK